jgi:hypothetical protein
LIHQIKLKHLQLEINTLSLQYLHYNIAKTFRAVSRLDIKLRFLVACYKVHPDYVRGILGLYNEITFNQVEQAATKLQDKHTVDRTNGYEPYDLK